MRRTTLLIASVLLAVPSLAQANVRSPHGSERSGPFEVGIGLTQTIPSPDELAAARNRTTGPPSDRGLPWIWVLSIAAAPAVAGMRRRGDWGTA